MVVEVGRQTSYSTAMGVSMAFGVWGELETGTSWTDLVGRSKKPNAGIKFCFASKRKLLQARFR